MKSIYLDYAAATPMDPEVLKAMEPYFTQDFYNPSAAYLASRSVRNKLNEARAKVAQILGARPAEVIFTAGATEANNLAIQGIMNQYPAAKILISAIEHDSVIAPAKLFNCQQIPVNEQGLLDLNALKKLIDDDTVLVSVMFVNNELGTIQPLKEISQLLNKLSDSRIERGIKMPLYLHTDAAQAPNFLDLHVSRLGVDLLSINGGKIYGPKQSGALYVKAGVKLRPQILGGGQEFGARSGTENIAADIGLAAALTRAQDERAKEAERLKELQKIFEDKLSQECPDVKINGSLKHRAPHISSVTFAACDNERLMMQLDEAGIMAAVGSACSASSDEPSHVLAAIGMPKEDIRATLRFSFGRQTTKDQIEQVINTLKKLV